MPRGDWADVDGAEDPASFVRWLDVSRQSQAVMLDHTRGRLLINADRELRSDRRTSW
jgi:hypothetical protein